MRKWKQNDNTDNGEKIEIRHRLLRELSEPHVLECYAGEGKVYKECYAGLPYLGLDKKNIQDGRQIVNIDNRKYLRSADLEPFNFFDLDAYGSPWHQFLIILERRMFQPNKKVAFVLTEGLDFKMRMSSLPVGMMKYVGIKPGMRIPMLHNHADFIRNLFVSNAAKKAGLKIQLAYIAQNKRKTMRYMGLLLHK